MTIEQKECAKMSAHKTQTPGIHPKERIQHAAVAYPGILFGGCSTNSVEDRREREQGSGGGSPLVRGSGGSCNSVQEI